MEYTKRVVILVDMDCFYCQVEEGLNPDLKGKPIAVVQYNAWKGGGIIAVNYVAKDRGVKRHMRGDEAKQVCPDIELVRVTEVRGKADLQKYREAGKRVAMVLQLFTPLLQRASVDEAYLDVTEEVSRRINNQVTPDLLQNTFIVGHDKNDFVYNSQHEKEYSESDLLLLHGAVLAEEIRAAVFEKTGYRCSAGIAHNKILAKLVCGLHKPNKQTVLPHNAVPDFFKDVPIRKITGLGGKLGESLSEKLGITYLGELCKFSEKELRKYDGKNGTFLYNLARGINLDPVTTRLVPKSIGSSKTFPGKSSLVTVEDVTHWLNELSKEICVRLEQDLEENNRRSKKMVLSFSQKLSKEEVSSSRTYPLKSYNSEEITANALKLIRQNCLRSDGSCSITYLGLSAGDFEENKNNLKITSFFKRYDNNIASDTLNNSAEECSINESCESKVTNSNLQPIRKTLSSCSVWSASTEEFSEDEENMIFYPKSNVTQDERNTYKSDYSNESDDSIGKELEQGFKLNRNVGSDKPQSFFMNYFNQEKDKIERNFDNSKIFESGPITQEGSGHFYEESNVSIKKPDFTIPTNSNVQNSPANDLIQVCPECKKTVPDCDFVSHMDHHFALKIVKEESHLNKKTPKPSQSEPVEFKKNGNFSEKSNDNLKKPGFTTQTNTQNSPTNDLMQVCPDCKKTIPDSEFVSHMDYHFALKIVKEESHLYKQAPKPSRSGVVEFGKRHKRKHENLDNKNKNGNITSFLNSIPNEVDMENTKLCAECNKRIKLDEEDIHKDYHFAKKLVSESNTNNRKIVINKSGVNLK